MATKTATNAKVTHATPKAVTINEPIIWAVAVLVEMNKLSPSKKKIPITVNNVETLLRPITGEGSMGQQGGFLRDNNPWNIGTWRGQHGGTYGGTTVDLYNNGIWINQFPSALAGARATAQYLIDNHAYTALANNAPSPLVLSKTWYAGDAKAQSAVPVKADQVVTAAHKLGSLADISPGSRSPTGPAGPVGPLTEQQIIKEWEAVIRQTHNSQLPAGSPILTAFSSLPYAQRQSITKQIEQYAQTYNNPDTTLGADIGRGFDKVTNAVASPLASLGHFFSDLTQLDFWKRVGMGVLGVGLVIGGVVIFLQSTKTVQGIEGKVVP